MNRINIIILVCVIGLCSCSHSDEKKSSDTLNGDSIGSMKMATDSNAILSAIDSSHTAQNSLDWNGTYTGVLPCADCEGMETEIMLHKDSTYMLSVKYVGKKDAKIFTSEGKFTWIDGFNIKLEGVKEGSPATYFVGENKLTQLDMQGKKIEGSLASKYILIKK